MCVLLDSDLTQLIHFHLNRPEQWATRRTSRSSSWATCLAAASSSNSNNNIAGNSRSTSPRTSTPPLTSLRKVLSLKHISIYYSGPSITLFSWREFPMAASKRGRRPRPDRHPTLLGPHQPQGRRGRQPPACSRGTAAASTASTHGTAASTHGTAAAAEADDAASGE